MSVFKKVFKNKVIFANFCKIHLLLFVIILCITLFVYHRSKQVLEAEFTMTNLNYANQTSQNLDEILNQSKRLAAYLTVDTMIQIFFASDSPDRIIDKFYEQILQKITAYSYGIDYIDSVYLYSPYTNDILSSNAQTLSAVTDFSLFSDREWLKLLEADQDKTNSIKYATRAINNRYPYVISVISHSFVGGTEGVVVINLNLNKLYASLTTQKNYNQQLFVIDEDGSIIMKSQKAALYENREDFPILASYREGADSGQSLVDDADMPYSFAQVKSELSGYTCVTVTELTEYTALLSHTQGIALALGIFFVLAGAILAILFSLHAFKPIQNIMDLLDDPVSWHDAREKSPEEIRKIADRIISNLQTSESLRRELAAKLNLLDRTRIQALQAQMNPHFLFNTLNMISLSAASGLGEEHPAALMPVLLAQILRYSLESPELVSLDTELYYTKLYVSLLEERYAGLFQTDFEVSPDVKEAGIPKLCLQPLIENAVYHGLAGREEESGGILTVAAKRTQYSFDTDPVPCVWIQITDNGCGISAKHLQILRESLQCREVPDSSHIGIRNVMMRLNLLFHDCVRLDMESEEGKGTKLTVLVPFCTIKENISEN